MSLVRAAMCACLQSLPSSRLAALPPMWVRLTLCGRCISTESDVSLRAGLLLQTAWALFQLCAGSVECRRSICALQEHVHSMAVHARAQAPSHAVQADSSDISVDDVMRWMTSAVKPVMGLST